MTRTHPHLLGRRLARVAVGLLLLGAGAAMLVWQQQVRFGEVTLAGVWFDLVLSGPTYTNRDVIYFGWAESPLIGMRATWECTVALLAGPLCAVAAVVLALTRVPWVRVVAGLGVGLVLLVVVNQIRLAMIAVSIQGWGLAGYDLTHKSIGSIFAIAGFVVAALVFLKIAGATTQRRRRSLHLA